MHFVAMDGARLTVLMIAGGIFSVAGILLMFRAKQEGSSARTRIVRPKVRSRIDWDRRIPDRCGIPRGSYVRPGKAVSSVVRWFNKLERRFIH